MDIRKCDVSECPNTFIAGYGYSLVVNWVVTGHAHVRAYMCEQAEGGQHWGCSPEHAVIAMRRCLESHMGIQSLLNKHNECAQRGLTRYAPSDEVWAKSRGENFHIVDFKFP